MTTENTKLLGSATGDASLIRPKFSSGLLLQDDDLTQSIDYMHNMSRLLFRSMLGCGVLCGFEVNASIVCKDHLKIEVAKGVALDCHGDLIELPKQEAIQYAPPCDVDLPAEVWVVICHKERDCSPRDVLCSTQDGEVAPVYTRTREGYQIKVIDSQVQPNGCCGCKSTEENKAAEDTGGVEAEEAQRTCCDYIAIPANNDDCSAKHYNGACACDCNCDCIVLANVKISKPYKEGNLPIDHSVRRFIRPVLMKAPLPIKDQAKAKVAVAPQMAEVAKQQEVEPVKQKVKPSKGI